MSFTPDVIDGNVLQVRFQAVKDTRRGIFKVMTTTQVSEYFGDPQYEWVDGGTSRLPVGSNTMSDNAFQILIHHWVKECGNVEAWYVTVHPAF